MERVIPGMRIFTKESSPDEQVALFGDAFGDLDFEDRVEFYKHTGKWTNRMILGDSLLVMASLAEKEGLKGHVQMIYIDPPYGIKFGSNWQVSTRKRDDSLVENSHYSHSSLPFTRMLGYATVDRVAVPAEYEK